VVSRDESTQGFDWGFEIRKLHRFVMRHFHKNSADADDVVQETYMKFCEIPDDVVVGNPSGLLCTIAKNVVIDIHRRHATELKWMPALILAHDAAQDDPYENKPVDELCRSEMPKEVAKVSEQLNPLQRAVLEILLDDEKLTHQQIAARLSCSIFAIRRATARIRRAYKDF
jgi:RNA polymerase sigma factor (sigma-70 family)